MIAHCVYALLHMRAYTYVHVCSYYVYRCIYIYYFVKCELC